MADLPSERRGLCLRGCASCLEDFMPVSFKRIDLLKDLRLSPRGMTYMFALLSPPPKSIQFSMALLLLKGIAVIQTFRGARNQWFWLLNRKLKALSVPLSWLEGLGLKWLLSFKRTEEKFCVIWKNNKNPFLEPWAPALVNTQHGKELLCYLAVMTANKCVWQSVWDLLGWGSVCFVLMGSLTSFQSPHLLYHPHSRESGRAWLCQAGLGPTGYSDPAGAIRVCVYLQDACCSQSLFFPS